MKPVRVVVMGPSGVGKTSIIRILKSNSKKRLTWKPWSRCRASGQYVPTQDPCYPHQVKIGGHNIEILDMAGSSEFPLMRHYVVRTGDAFVLVFSVEDQTSFDRIAEIRKEILDLYGASVPILVLGNKTDTGVRQVLMELADCLTSIDWEHTYSEVSAVDAKTIGKVFKNLVTSKILQTKLPNMPKRRQSLPRNDFVFLKHLFVQALTGGNPQANW